jgi:K+-sensing histidine kinase KdpD
MSGEPLMIKNNISGRWSELLDDLKKEFHAREEELLTLQELDRHLVENSLDQENIYQFIIDKIGKLCNAEVAQVLIRNRDNLRIVASHPEEAIEELLSIKECATGLCVETRQPFNSENIWEDKRIKNRYADILSPSVGKILYSELAVPMIIEKEVIGVLNAESPRPGAFDDHHQAILSTFAAQCAIAFSRVKLVDEIKLFQDVLTALSKDDSDITVPEIVNESLRNLDRFIGSVKHYQILFVEHDEMIIAFSSLGQDIGARVRIDQSVSGRAIRMKRTQIVNDVRKDEDFRQVLGTKIKSEMAIPINIGGNNVGVINLESEQPSYFDGFSSVIVEQFSHQIQWILTLLRFKHEGDRNRKHNEALDVMKAIGSQTSNLMHTLKNDLLPAKLACEKISQKFSTLLSNEPELKKKIDVICSSIIKAYAIPKGINAKFQKVVEVEIKKTIEQIFKTFRKDMKEMKFILKTEPKLPNIKCRSFNGVISNLLRNAVEATGKLGTVWILAKLIEFKDLDEKYVEIIVDDDGPGVPLEYRDKLFDWEFTTKKGKEAKGFGFGLAWTKTLVEVEGGQIKAENNDKGGARFIVKYPVTSKK